MDMFGILILSTAISISNTRNLASNEQDAYRAIMKASYIQTGMDKQVKNIEKKYTPNYVKEYGGWITLTGKVITSKKISYEWTF
jgi:hypothetical protein